MVRRTLAGVLCALLLTAIAAPVRAQEGSSGPANGNTGVTPISREEAAKRLPPPIPVVDISKPALVYNHPDELIRAAVADYLSKIKEPHDRFGNIISKNYKSATTPDKLDGKLIQHIIQFVGGRRQIALSPRQALGINQLQERKRQNEIDKIIYDDWAKRTREKFQNSNGGGAGGNANGNPNSNTGGPPGQPGNTNTPANTNTGSNTNTNSNSNSNGGVGGGTNNNGNQGTGGENVPNVNNANGAGNQNSSGNGNTSGNTNTPGATAQSARMAQEFGVEIDMQPKAWESAELDGLEEVLKKLPRRFYQGVKFKRVEGISETEGGPINPRILGVCYNSGATSGTMELANGYKDEGNLGAKQDWPTPPYDLAEAKKIHMKAVLAHEITHNFQFYGEGKRIRNFSTESELIKNWARTFGWEFDSAKGSWKLTDPERRKERVSNYATGTIANPTSPMEDMSESVAFYLFDPQRLKATSAGGRSRYDFVRDILGVAQQSDAPITIGTPEQRGFL